MGKIKIGILGGFSGKVGPVVGTSWKGKAIIRAKALSINNPNTEEQQRARTHFALLAKFCSRTAGFVNVGFKGMAKGMTECNAALAANYAEGVSGTWPNYALDYSKLLVSYGPLDLPDSPAAQLNGNTLDISWTDNSATCNGSSLDNVMLLYYNSTKEQATYNVAAAQRSTTSCSYEFPANWAGDIVEVYLAICAAKNSATSKSVYLGQFTV